MNVILKQLQANSLRILLLAIMAVAGVFMQGVYASPGPEAVVDEQRPPTWVNWSLDSASTDDRQQQSFVPASDDESSPFKLRKRSKRCWRPEQVKTILVVATRLPAYAPPLISRAALTLQSSLTGSYLLFITGGYTRLFQKG